MKILITGGKGMLGRTLQQTLSSYNVATADIDDFDITNRQQVLLSFENINPDVVIHCAAMTAVDRCEIEKDLAFRINAGGSENIAQACAKNGTRLIAISTDYVFSGNDGRPYREDDTPVPQTVYGQSKLAGEDAIRSTCPDHLIARIAWLYGPGGPSFLHTMLKLAKNASAPLRVVNDQRGNPTSTLAVADHIALLLQTSLKGTVHLTCEGAATWFDFAREIFRLSGLPVQINPCATSEYPRPAPRPADSQLENSALKENGLPPMPHWQEALKSFLQTYPQG